MAYESVKNQIDAYINANGVNLITGPVLNAVLTTMLDELGEGYAFQGVLNTTDTPSPAADIPQAWLASAGTYLGGSITVDEGELALIIHTADGWSKETVYRGVQLSHDAILDALGYTPADEADLAEKQDTIADLPDIRSGAALGSTSVQPVDIEDMVEAEPIGSIIPPVNPSEFATKEEISQLSQEVKELTSEVNGATIPFYPTWAKSDQYLNAAGTPKNASNWAISAPFLLKRNETIVINTQGAAFCAIAQTDIQATAYTPLVVSPGSASGNNPYSYTATDDVYIALSGKIGFGDVTCTRAIGENLDARVDELETTATEMAEELSIVSVFNPSWEIGNITMRDTGWTYSALGSRTRLRQGQTLHLYVGDVIGLSDYSAARYYVGWRKLDGTYNYKGWLNQNFSVTEEGFYVILITAVPEATVGQASDLGDLFFVLSLRERVFSREPKRSIRSIAHQGYAPSGQEKNNLAEGYILAASVGFNFGECDLVFSSDKVPFCCHATKIGDEWINAFYDPLAEEYVYFAENTASQILSHAFIDANHHVSTFEEVIAACKSVGMGLYVDGINNIADDDEWGAVFNIIKYYAMMDKTVFLATNETQANKILSLYPNAEISFLTSLNAGAIARSNALKTVNNKISMDVNGSTLTGSDIKTAYDQLVPGVTIEVYTINDLTKYKELMPYVVGITSDSIAEPML